MLWILIAVMLAAAIAVVAVPLYRTEKRMSATMVISILTVTALSAFIYTQIGTPDATGQTSAQQAAEVDEMVSSLATRLEKDPGDVSGWKMLGRSYFSLRNFPEAIAAFEKAVELEGAQDGQTLTDLGEAIIYSDADAIVGHAGDLFENALALTPNNPKALFYGGMTAIQRGNKELGASRWEALLATSPPPNVQEILRQQIAELRGESPVAVTEAAPAPAPAAGMQDPVTGININVSLGENAQAANLPDTTVFIIVRDPLQPSPPIAAVRRRLVELPTAVSIGDSDAMIPGRVPSGFDRLEIIARISLGGQPVAVSGDWFGDAIIETADTANVEITIDQQVP
jgi:cytochrome c-type biogenesis protein CcmH